MGRCRHIPSVVNGERIPFRCIDVHGASIRKTKTVYTRPPFGETAPCKWHNAIPEPSQQAHLAAPQHSGGYSRASHSSVRSQMLGVALLCRTSAVLRAGLSDDRGDNESRLEHQWTSPAEDSGNLA